MSEKGDDVEHSANKNDDSESKSSDHLPAISTEVYTDPISSEPEQPSARSWQAISGYVGSLERSISDIFVAKSCAAEVKRTRTLTRQVSELLEKRSSSRRDLKDELHRDITIEIETLTSRIEVGVTEVENVFGSLFLEKRKAEEQKKQLEYVFLMIQSLDDAVELAEGKVAQVLADNERLRDRVAELENNAAIFEEDNEALTGMVTVLRETAVDVKPADVLDPGLNKKSDNDTTEALKLARLDVHKPENTTSADQPIEGSIAVRLSRLEKSFALLSSSAFVQTLQRTNTILEDELFRAQSELEEQDALLASQLSEAARVLQDSTDERIRLAEELRVRDERIKELESLLANSAKGESSQNSSLDQASEEIRSLKSGLKKAFLRIRKLETTIANGSSFSTSSQSLRDSSHVTPAASFGMMEEVNGSRAGGTQLLEKLGKIASDVKEMKAKATDLNSGRPSSVVSSAVEEVRSATSLHYQ